MDFARFGAAEIGAAGNSDQFKSSMTEMGYLISLSLVMLFIVHPKVI